MQGMSERRRQVQMPDMSDSIVRCAHIYNRCSLCHRPLTFKSDRFFSLMLRSTSCSVGCSVTHKRQPCDVPAPKKLSTYRPKPQLLGDGGDESADPYLLSQEKLEGLCAHAEVARKFRDDRMKQILRRIDSAKDRGAALEREMEDPEFLEFCDDILEALGFKPRDEKPVTLHDILSEQCGDL